MEKESLASDTSSSDLNSQNENEQKSMMLSIEPTSNHKAQTPSINKMSIEQDSLNLNMKNQSI